MLRGTSVVQTSGLNQTNMIIISKRNATNTDKVNYSLCVTFKFSKRGFYLGWALEFVSLISPVSYRIQLTGNGTVDIAVKPWIPVLLQLLKLLQKELVGLGDSNVEMCPSCPSTPMINQFPIKAAGHLTPKHKGVSWSVPGMIWLFMFWILE